MQCARERARTGEQGPAPTTACNPNTVWQVVVNQSDLVGDVCSKERSRQRLFRPWPETDETQQERGRRQEVPAGAAQKALGTSTSYGTESSGYLIPGAHT